MTGPYNSVSQVERRHSDAAPGIGGRVCVVVGDEDENRIFFCFFEKQKAPVLLKIIGQLET